ncbi:hypothetical protein [Roseateles sp.]|uniref:hypothetical protein n=1 Tax=Roseateles sp. TaxID=1971397 RepID=UPI0025CF2223|nr:hypothetical protein [Roseateles sp.]MBV8035540.1 hypothetical protein [Roseateles sp.]
MTTLLIDNDVVIKLAQMNAYVDGLAAIDYSPADIGSPSVMLKFMGLFSEEKRQRLTHNDAEAARLLAALQSITAIEPTEPEMKTIAALGKLALEHGLDLQAGELMLLGIAISRGGMRVATGDKRALRALPDLATRWPEVNALHRQFYCLEQIVNALADAHDLARVRAAVTTSPRADETISFAYDKTHSSGKHAFMAFLDMVIEEHIEKPAPGWLYQP